MNESISRRLAQETHGSSLVEYLFLTGLIALAALMALHGTASALSAGMSTLGSTVQSSVSH